MLHICIAGSAVSRGTAHLTAAQVQPSMYLLMNKHPFHFSGRDLAHFRSWEEEADFFSFIQRHINS